MAIAENIVCVWTGTNATIPTGWSRDTDFDGKYVLGADAAGNGGATGGNATHTHTVDAHTHIEDQHRHTFSAAASASSTSAPLSTATFLATTTHTHASTNGAYTSDTLNNATVTLDGTSNDPTYYEVIFVKSAGTHDIADDCITWFDSSTLPTGWQFCNGDNSSPDLRNKFLKGAAAAGDSGGTGGSATHTHTNTSHLHSHNAHTHSAVNSANSSAGAKAATAGSGIAAHTHYHSVSLNSNTQQDTNLGSVTVDSANGEPTFKKLLPIQNQTGNTDAPTGIICLWKSTAASIPENWARYTDMDTYFCKCCNADTEIGDAGGSAQHAHTDTTGHTHTNSVHNHTAAYGSSSAQTASGSGATYLPYNHSHAWTIGNATPAIDSVEGAVYVTINNCDSQANYPSYLKAIFIKYTAPSAAYYHTMIMET